MGRIFEKRKDRMFARWSKMSKAFTKIGREIAIAVKLGGPNPSANTRLRVAIQNARSVNMPKDKIENAIQKAASKSEAAMDEVYYEAYGPGGVAIFIETATDNTTRTVANVRNIVSKHGGNLATNGALDFVFNRQGVFCVVRPDIELEQLELDLIDHGLEEMFETEDGDFLLYSSFSGFGDMQKYLESQKIEIKSSSLQRLPVTEVEVTEDAKAQILKMIDYLDDDDDVQQVYHNMKQ